MYMYVIDIARGRVPCILHKTRGRISHAICVLYHDDPYLPCIIITEGTV